MNAETKIEMNGLFYSAMMYMPKDERIRRWENFKDEEKIELLNMNMPDTWLMEMFNLNRNQLRKIKDELGYKNIKLQSLGDILNKKIKDEVLFNDLHRLSAGLTHFIFRNGPIEDMHADKNKNILDEDMKVLNKYMMSHLTTVLYLLKNERYLDLVKVLEFDMNFGQDWDKVTQEEINEIISNAMFPLKEDL